MTDFFDDLERELRRAHRRDTDRPARSRVLDLPWLPGLPAASLRTLVALAVVLALVAVVATVARESDVERPAAPQPSPTSGPGALGGCVPSKWWRAPIVDEPIPPAIASRLAIFRDPPPRAELPRDFPIFPGARKKYSGAVMLRPRFDTGTRLRVDMIAADITTEKRPYDPCSPPPDPVEPGICVHAFDPNGPEGVLGTKGDIGCFSIDEIEDARAWFKLTRKTVFGLAPDGVDRVSFDTPAGTQSLKITSNLFAGEIRSADSPYDPEAPPGAPWGTNTRFAP